MRERRGDEMKVVGGSREGTLTMIFWLTVAITSFHTHWTTSLGYLVELASLAGLIAAHSESRSC